MSKTIRVSDDTLASLGELKGDGETFDRFRSRQFEDRREAVRDGAGLWEGTDAPYERGRNAGR